jgi:hypothetical protein
MSASTSRPFNVLGIQQIAIGGTDKHRLRQLWVDKLGLALTGHFVSERENVDEDICAMGAGPFKVEVDLMQPLDADKKPAVHATPLNQAPTAARLCSPTTAMTTSVCRWCFRPPWRLVVSHPMQVCVSIPCCVVKPTPTLCAWPELARYP